MKPWLLQVSVKLMDYTVKAVQVQNWCNSFTEKHYSAPRVQNLKVMLKYTIYFKVMLKYTIGAYTNKQTVILSSCYSWGKLKAILISMYQI